MTRRFFIIIKFYSFINFVSVCSTVVPMPKKRLSCDIMTEQVKTNRHFDITWLKISKIINTEL